MVYGTHNYSYWGESKPTSITGGPHIVYIYICIYIYIIYTLWIQVPSPEVPLGYDLGGSVPAQKVAMDP